MEIFCRLLNKDIFEVFAVAKLPNPPLTAKLKVEAGVLLGLSKARAKKKNWQSMNARIPNFRKILGTQNVMLAKNDIELRQILLGLSPDVLHVHYSGRAEAPTSDELVMSQIPAVVTQNQFELFNDSQAHRHVKKIFLVSEWLRKNKAPWALSDSRTDVFYNLIDLPCSTENLRDKLGIPHDAFVIGRVGRPDDGIHDPISLRAYQQIQSEHTYFLALSPPPKMVREAQELGLKNFVPLPPTSDDVFLSKFYNTLDVLAHARRDGETFGCNIAEAMIHGKPVVSHLTDFMNAQEEVIGDGGVVCAKGDVATYAATLKLWKENPEVRLSVGKKAKTRALDQFESKKLTRRLEKTYLNLLGRHHESTVDSANQPLPSL